MSEYETTLNTLEELEYKMNRGYWIDIEFLEEEDERYSIALRKAIEAIKRLEDLCRQKRGYYVVEI